MPKFRKKPVVLEAVQWNGSNIEEIFRLMSPAIPKKQMGVDELFIETSEGTMRADVGDWIIKGVKGEFYPCKPDIFTALYDAVESDSLVGVVLNNAV